MAPEPPFSMAEAISASVKGRIHQQIHAFYARHIEPAWIILGQEEWLELRYVEMLYQPAWMLAPDAIPEYHGVKIATVPIGHFLEVVPKLP